MVFGASFVLKRLVSNLIPIDMNYCSRPLSPRMSFFVLFVLFCFSLSKPPLYQRDLFPTQYLLVWIIVVDPFLQQCHFFVCLFVCFLFFSFGASFVPKKLVSNLICISMNYCCESLSPTMSVLFCFVFLFWSLLSEKEICFQLNIY